jgi:glycosidase
MAAAYPSHRGNCAKRNSRYSPYAIQDYRKINPEYGTLEDFKSLVDAIHSRSMKCIIDVVYNHTSPDSWLAQHHPEWFYHKQDGSSGSKGGNGWMSSTWIIQMLTCGIIKLKP